MSVHPPAADLLASVSHFLRDELLPQLAGADAFNLRVSINAIELVRREIELQGGADARERERLTALLGGDADLDALRDELCRKIAAGDLTLDQPMLREHLRATAIDRLAIDQPTYSAYLAAVARRDAAAASKKRPAEE
jgi:Domain of unknown function (DUF6285)